MFWCFDELFSKGLQKVAQFVKKHEKSSIWPKLCSFSKNYHVFAFRWTFQEKVAKSASFREKARKIIDLAKTLQLFEHTTMSFHFDELFRKKLQKVPHFVKKHEKPSIWPKLATFRTNYHVLIWTSQQEVAKSASFRGKSTRNHRFRQNLQFFEQTTMSWHFHELFRKKLQKVPFLWKSTRNHRFNQNLQLFEKTTIYFRFDELYGKKLQKLPHFVKKHEKSSIWPKLSTFRANYHVSCKTCLFVKKHEKFRKTIWPKLSTFRKKGRNIIDLAKTLQLFELHVFGFSWTSQQEVAKSASFRGKSTRNHRFGQNYATFSKKLPCLCISINFSGKSCKEWLNSWKRTKYHRFGQNFATFRTTTMSLDFDQLFTEKLQKVPHFVKKHEKSSIWPKLSTFRANYHVSAFSWTSQQEVAKSASFRGKSTRNHRFGQNYATFSDKLPCLCISIDFSGKSCKKWLNSWKRTKYHRFGQNFATFRTTTMSLDFDQLFTEKLQKVPHFVKKHEKSSIWPKLSTFRANYHVSAFSWTSQQEVAKSASFRGKSTRNHRFRQNYATFPKKLACLCISINFSGKSCKKWLNSWKRTKYHRFGQNFATFRTTTMSLDFDQLFRKKLQKVPHFVKKHEKSSIWPNLYNFSNKLPSLWISMNFSRKSCKKCVVSWKSTKNHRFCQLANFRENYHVLTFRWTLQQKVAKGCSCREKARKIINLAKSLQLYEQTSMILHFDEFSRKKLPKVLPFVKKHESSSIWPKLCNFSSKLPCFGISMKFSAKSYKKCLISWKSTKNRRFCENSQLFQQTTMFWRFGELFSEKLQKVPRFLRKL